MRERNEWCSTCTSLTMVVVEGSADGIAYVKDPGQAWRFEDSSYAVAAGAPASKPRTSSWLTDSVSRSMSSGQITGQSKASIQSLFRTLCHKSVVESYGINQPLTERLEQAATTPWWPLIVVIDRESSPCSYQNPLHPSRFL